MINDKVSIIMPIYNSEKYLERSIKSVINQSYKNIELILVDDGSTDNSLKICHDFAEKDSRVIVVCQKNSGASVARNNGISCATGKYIEFIDADDYLDKNCTKTLVENLGDSDLVICGYKLYKKSITINKFYKKSIIEPKVDCVNFFEMVKSGVFNCVWNKLYRKSLINNQFDKSYVIGEDTLFNIGYLKNINKISIIPNLLYNYDFTNENSVTYTRLRDVDVYNSYWKTLYDFYAKYFTTKDYLNLLNGIYLKSTLTQLITLLEKNNLTYKDYKKTFNDYRNLTLTKNALKNYNHNVFYKKNKKGKIVILLFKLRMKLLLFFAFKIYKKKQENN